MGSYDIDSKIQKEMFPEEKIENEVNLADLLSPPVSQGYQGTCFSFAIARSVETALKGTVSVSP